VVDAASGLTGHDLALIIRHLHAIRQSASPEGLPFAPDAQPPKRAFVLFMAPR
jgi:hypothetical protein